MSVLFAEVLSEQVCEVYFERLGTNSMVFHHLVFCTAVL